MNVDDDDVVRTPSTTTTFTLLTEATSTAALTTEADAAGRLPLSGRAPITKVFIDDLTERRRTWRIPWFVINMCWVQILLYAIANECIYKRLMLIPGHRADYWRYFTYMLLHTDLSHLLLNVCLQCLIGFCLESEQRHMRVALVYVAGGVSGSLATTWLHPQLSLLGASAGVYAMLMSHVPHLLKVSLQLWQHSRRRD